MIMQRQCQTQTPQFTQGCCFTFQADLPNSLGQAPALGLASLTRGMMRSEALSFIQVLVLYSGLYSTVQIVAFWWVAHGCSLASPWMYTVGA